MRISCLEVICLARSMTAFFSESDRLEKRLSASRCLASSIEKPMGSSSFSILHTLSLGYEPLYKLFYVLQTGAAHGTRAGGFLYLF